MKIAIPDHELLSVIGRGAYGEVWLARNVMGVGRAVKIVRREAFSDARPYEREFAGIRRYEPVSRHAQGLVNVLHVGRNDEAAYFYYVMELGDADDSHPDKYAPMTLKTLLGNGPLPPENCAAIAQSLAAALNILHRAGLAHRDIKPSNIIFVGGAAKLADIGLVVEQGESLSFIGTEGYMPPEGMGSPQGDIFSLGIVLYEMVTGRDGSDFPSVPQKELIKSKAGLELLEIIIHACESDPAARYRNAGEMAADLALVRSGKSLREIGQLRGRLRMARTVAIALGTAGIVIAAALWMSEPRSPSESTVSVAAGAGPVSFSPDGKFLITADSNQVARWKLPLSSNKQPQNVFPTRMTTAILWMPDGKTMHTSGYQPTTRFDAGWTAIQATDFPLPDSDAEAWSRDANMRIVAKQTAGAQAGQAVIFRGKTIVHTHTVPTTGELVIGLRADISPDGNWAAMAAFKGIGWQVWNTASGKQVAGGSDSATIRFSPDGRWLAVAGQVTNDVWEVGPWKLRHQWKRIDLDAHFGQAAWSADSSKLAILSGRQGIIVVSASDWSTRETFHFPDAGHITAMAFHPAGKQLAIAATNGLVRVFPVRSQK